MSRYYVRPPRKHNKRKEHGTKRCYTSWQEAWAAAEHLMRDTSERIVAYRCYYGGKNNRHYHIGHAYEGG